MIILGIDAALRRTGYGVVRHEGRRFHAIDCGVLHNKPGLPLSECLRRLAGGIGEMVDRFTPNVAAIEGGFFFKNAKTSMILGMARGAVVTVLAQRHVVTYEYAPRKARKVVLGHGAANKRQVADFMAQMLALDVSEIPDDATDAMAIALCHGVNLQTANGVYLPEPI